VGSLEVGKQLDAVIVNGDAVDLLNVGVPAIRAVVKRGALCRTAQTAPGV
jgi:imidazolonepropionase-like amidohydrolase